LLPLSLALPLTYGFDAIRALLLGVRPLLALHYEIAILIGFMAVMTPLGYFVFKRIERYCQMRGTLSMH
jgi:ABC-2 type transport system permease protein